MRILALAFILLLLTLLAWVVFRSSGVTIVVNGHTLTGPAQIAAEGWGLLVAVVVLFCASILLAFVFVGVGLIVLGALVAAALVAVWVAFPFLLPILIPLGIVWLFVALFRGRRRAER